VASLQEIAASINSYDVFQVEYYGLRTQQMVGKGLANNGVLEPVIKGRKIVGYRLLSEILTEVQRSSLIGLCYNQIDTYIEKRGGSI
tara:strand:- start:2 stop:262 length:261 start_codon:yes stop_codon:yes gene_type:complete